MKKRWVAVGILAFSLCAVKMSDSSDKKPLLEVKIGEGENAIKLEANGYIQTQFEHYENATDTFKLLRARPRVKGDLGEYLDFFIQLDLAYSTVMRDGWVELDYVEYAKLRMGQFTLPFGWQTPQSPYKLLTINYAQAVDNLDGGDDLRDIGVMLHGNFRESENTLLKMFGYAVAGVNGEGSNTSDQNDPKSLVGRIGLSPFEGLELGASVYRGKRGTAKYDRNRIDADLRYRHKNIIIQGEYIHSSDDTVLSSIEPHTLGGKGYFAEAGYSITPQIQPVFRFDVWDPEAPGTYGKLTKYVPGFNFYINDYTRLQAIYEFRDEEKNEIKNNAFITQLGISF